MSAAIPVFPELESGSKEKRRFEKVGEVMVEKWVEAP
jgi:hypothetical protein